ncbi:MAG: hypothetical protein ACTJGH_00265 [Peptoniphilaceae bacterium]
MSDLNKELAVNVALKVLDKVEIKNGTTTSTLKLDSIINIIEGVYRTLENFDKEES